MTARRVRLAPVMTRTQYVGAGPPVTRVWLHVLGAVAAIALTLAVLWVSGNGIQVGGG